MRKPLLDQLPTLAPLPSGYLLRHAGQEDAADIAGLLTASSEDWNWTASDVARVLIDASDVDRVFVVALKDNIVATASTQLSLDEPTKGWLHWVAAHPRHRRIGLGRTVSLSVLHRLGELRCTEVNLKTDPHRRAAIRLYWELGFRPVEMNGEHAAVWNELLRQERPQ
jgi:ribosomal protein S18 acetylase RimI-like enzyme